MKKQEGNWTPEDLDHFLTNPRVAIPGTAMSFAGLPRGKERADVIAYLNSNSDSPQDLSKLAAAAAPAKQADAPKTEAPKPQ
jgi:cytochrome c